MNTDTKINENTTAVAIPGKADLAIMFRRTDGIDPILKRIEDEVRQHIPDVTTKKGRDAIASLAYRVARSKTILDEAGKALNEEARAQINAVDAERRKVRDRLDKLKDEAREPLDKWEAAEAERVDAIKARLGSLSSAMPHEESSQAYVAMIAKVEAAVIDETWQEFLADAAKAKDATLSRLRSGLNAVTDKERLAEENARLRAEAEARAEDERLRREAEEAERKRIEAERAEAEHQARIEREKQEAAERATREAEQRARVEAERIRREEEERVEAERRAAADREAELRRQIEESKRREEEAAQRERDRIAEERKAEEAALAKRKADAAHRSRIQTEIAAALEAYEGAGAMVLADAIIGGSIPHVKAVL